MPKESPKEPVDSATVVESHVEGRRFRTLSGWHPRFDQGLIENCTFWRTDFVIALSRTVLIPETRPHGFRNAREVTEYRCGSGALPNAMGPIASYKFQRL